MCLKLWILADKINSYRGFSIFLLKSPHLLSSKITERLSYWKPPRSHAHHLLVFGQGVLVPVDPDVVDDGADAQDQGQTNHPVPLAITVEIPVLKCCKVLGHSWIYQKRPWKTRSLSYRGYFVSNFEIHKVIDIIRNKSYICKNKNQGFVIKHSHWNHDKY